MGEDLNLKKMRDDIYQQLRTKYAADPESLSVGAKAVLAVFATTRYMDHYDALGDMFADMDRRLVAAEKIMMEVLKGTFSGPGDYYEILHQLVPLEMIETVEAYPNRRDMANRMHNVKRISGIYMEHEYERAHGLPLTDFTSLLPTDSIFTYPIVPSDTGGVE